MWVELEDGNHANLAAVLNLYSVDVGGGVFKVACNPGAGAYLAGVAETSHANARDVIRRLVHGISVVDVI